MPLPDLGAKRFFSLEELTDRQRAAAKRVLSEVRGLAESIKRELDDDRAVYDRHFVYRHPRYVFVIDGNRGSGKTTLLLTLHHLLTNLGAGERDIPDKKTRESLKSLSLLEPSHGNPMPPLVLSILNPNEMEKADDTMENIFAQIAVFLKREGEEKKSLAAACAQLKDKLYNEVALGWSFSRDLGVETLSRDSLDYQDFVRQRAEQATSSYTRQQSWRNFVNEFLDLFSRQLLVICIDDTDLAPTVTEGILHSIRMYLSHPRIVVLLCMNLKYIRHTLELMALQRIAPALSNLSPSEADQARWQERQITDEYLYKILPPSLHLRLNLERGDLDILYRHYSHSDVTWKETVRQRAMKHYQRGDRADARSWRLFHESGDDLLTALPLREVCELVRLFSETDRSVPDLLDEHIRRGPTFTLLVRRLQERNILGLDDLLRRPELNFSWTSGSVLCSIGNARYRREDPEFLLIEWMIDRAVAEAPPSQLDWLPRHLPQLPVSDSTDAAPPKAGLAGYLPFGSAPRNCLYFRDLIRIAGVLQPPAASAVSAAPPGNWTSDLVELRKRKNAALVSPHLRAAFDAEAQALPIAVADFHARSIAPTAQPIYSLPALWLLFHLAEEETEPLTVERVLSLLQSWADPGSASRDADFAPFLGKAQSFLLRRSYPEREQQQLLTCALRIALKSPGLEPGVKVLLDTFTGTDLRTEVLLLWSAAEILPQWLRSGIPVSELGLFQQLADSVSPLVERFRKRDPGAFEFLDLSEETQHSIENDILAAYREFQGLLATPEQIVLLDRDVDPFALDHRGQVAYILRTPRKVAEQFLDSIRG